MNLTKLFLGVEGRYLPALGAPLVSTIQGYTAEKELESGVGNSEQREWRRPGHGGYLCSGASALAESK